MFLIIHDVGVLGQTHVPPFATADRGHQALFHRDRDNVGPAVKSDVREKQSVNRSVFLSEGRGRNNAAFSSR